LIIGAPTGTTRSITACLRQALELSYQFALALGASERGGVFTARDAVLATGKRVTRVVEVEPQTGVPEGVAGRRDPPKQRLVVVGDPPIASEVMGTTKVQDAAYLLQRLMCCRNTPVSDRWDH